ncbi:MAG: sugar transferase [Chloroflexi bacterium]|jgi:lipopolysaccharide/colanic/teichoic acid biosynthesis glycosyltransferase|nr:sugar transferase [Chloroflexota bacterium]MBT5318683.1 sugar transferase [Chloroflexota bacterium]MBT6681426.1 sugar transferase [Chloroflexota bacterium]
MLKRSFDLVASLVGFVVLIPVMIIVAVAIVLESGWPIIYRAERTGLNGVPFKIIKFRSMRSAPAGAHSHHSGDDDPRITRVGGFIRKFKFDELPQLLNVIFGKMSLVGPRPETTEYTKLYTEEQMVIFSVRPGITDEASIVFSDLGSILSGGDPDELYFEKVWDPKMELRMKYVHEHSFTGDLALIFRTLAAPFSKRSSPE